MVADINRRGRSSHVGQRQNGRPLHGARILLHLQGQALQIVRGLVPLNLIGMDVVEVSPPYDHADLTALAAAHVACDLLCVLAAQRRARV